ncbi:S41 family peptidase [Solibacillus sp. FSL H8-0538]|uniref:S41 family peptidase n=1 Tax=Solibacillus sp. FSL H8-0538 TaxID=2921400 RepID=UPI0030FCB656
MIKRQLSLFLTCLVLLTFPLATFASPLDEVKEYVRDNYVGDMNGNLNKANSIESVIELLDPYSTYFTADEFEEFLNSVDLTSVGIGVVIEKHDNGILILQVIEGASAQLAGIEAGDVITAVNNTSTVTMSVQEASSLILGKENTSVKLTLLKQNGSSETKTIERKAFSLPNVTSSLLYGNVGYISLSSFSNDAASLVAKAVKSLKRKGATSFILDLQNNGGGYVTAAEQLIGMFPNAVNAYKLKLATGTSVAKAIPQAVKFPANTKLLVNRFSASSSEMTAAALLDQQSAVLYGEQTYGKGSMQSFFELSDGSYLKLTIGHFMGPANTVINNVGVKPTITTTSNPLYQAHLDAITEQLRTYRQKTSLLNVPTTKSFAISFNGSLTQLVASGAVELVELGGDTVATKFTQQDRQLIITPTKPLNAGSEYALIIHPTIKDASGKKIKRGYYLHITVAPKK